MDLEHIQNSDIKDEIEQLVMGYVPKKMSCSAVTMKLTLFDNLPVLESSRRLAPKERDAVREQIDEWLGLGIIKT